MPSGAEIMPYSDYVNGLRRDIVDGRLNAPIARAIVAATARCFLALDALQDGRIEEGIALLDAALADYPDHFAAARLLAKAYFAAGRPPGEIGAAVDRAVALYGPSLTELLPFAVAAAQSSGDTARALELVRQWCYFITRVTWRRVQDHPIPEQTWQSVEPLLDSLPAALAGAARRRRADRAAGKA